MAELLLFNDSAYEALSEVRKPVFIYDWLRGLEKQLLIENKQVIKECQEDLIQQLLFNLTRAPGRPTHQLIGRCLANLFMVGDSLLLYTAVNTCNGLLKSRDDGPASISSRLAALSCLGSIYERLGHMIGRSFEDSVLIIVKLIKQSESQVRSETMNTLCSLIKGVGSSIVICYKEIFKAVKVCMLDRVLYVRAAAAKCFYQLVDCAPSIYTTDLEATVSLCLRCMDGANFTTRLEASRLLGHLLAKTQLKGHGFGGLSNSLNINASNVSNLSTNSARSKTVSLADVFSLLSSGFLKGPGGFLKSSSATDMIKGTTNSVNREVRIGVTYAYVHFFQELGSQWFELHVDQLLSHVTNLLAQPRSTPTNIEAIWARQCIHYMLSTTFRTLLNDPIQMAVCRRLVHLVQGHMERDNPHIDHVSDGEDESPSCGPTSTMDLSETTAKLATNRRSKQTTAGREQLQHLIVCRLDLINQLIVWLDSVSVQLLDQSTNLVNVLFACLNHSSNSVRLSAASCLKQLAQVKPDQCVPLIRRAMHGLELQAQKSNTNSIVGLSLAISGLLVTANSSVLGISIDLYRQLFTLGEEFLRGANQNTSLTLARTQAGWNILAACMTLGSFYVKPYLGRMLLFWRNAFPRTLKELEAEKQRGDAFTWQIVFEARAGALSSIQTFFEYCSVQLLTDEIIHRLLPPVESALNMLGQMNDIVKIYGNHLKSVASFIRLRLYRILLLLPPTAYATFLRYLWQSGVNQQGAYSTLLRELVAEFTLTENSANITTSLLKSLCRSEDNIFMDTWSQDTDNRFLEEQLQPFSLNAPGALEHDPFYLYFVDGTNRILTTDVQIPNLLSQSDEDAPDSGTLTSGGLFYGPSVNSQPRSTLFSKILVKPFGTQPNPSGLILSNGPLPIGVAVIDASIDLFGRLFACVPVRHRIQMLDHFADCIRLTKSARQEAVQINIFAALLSAMRQLAEHKSAFGDDVNLRKSATSLIFAALLSPSVLLRCAASECLGRLALVVAEPNFLSDLAQNLFDRLRCIRNPVARAGHCLAIGCLHRYLGGLASGHHLSTSVGVLLGMAQDSSVPEVQVWALHALALVADSGGPIFREYVEPSLNLVLQLLLKSSSVMLEIQRSLGRLFAALITTLGPELRGSGSNIIAARYSCLLCCMIMEKSPDILLQAESMACLQQLHMFAPIHIKLASILPELQTSLTSTHLVIRRASVACLRQLSQKEAVDLCNLSNDEHKPTQEAKVDLELQLFSMLDVELDSQLRCDIKDTVVSMIQSTGGSRLSQWLNVLKEVLQVSTVSSFSKSATSRRLSKATKSKSTKSHSTSNGTVGLDHEQRARHCDNVGGGGDDNSYNDEEAYRDDGEEDDDEAEEHAGVTLGTNSQDSNGRPLWFKLISRSSTRVFAITCLRMLISKCFKMAQESAKQATSQSPSSNQHATEFGHEVAHFDLAKAQLLSVDKKSDYLISYLPDLIRIAFMSTTSDYVWLQSSGLKLMHQLIQLFCTVPDPDCPGHIILEQYQTQVSASVGPAFIGLNPSLDSTKSSSTLDDYPPQSNPELFALACQVCSTWIKSGVARDPEDLRRIQDLMKQGLIQRLDCSGDSESAVCSDQASLVEKLAILEAWAEIYIVVWEQTKRYRSPLNILLRWEQDDDNNDDDDGDLEFGDLDDAEVGVTTGRWGVGNKTIFYSDRVLTGGLDHGIYCRRTHQFLSQLVQPFADRLDKAWLSVLTDYAHLNLPAELADQCSTRSGCFYTKNCNLDQIRAYYAKFWPNIAYAASLYVVVKQQQQQHVGSHDKSNATELGKQFYLIVGMCIQAISNPSSKQPLSVVHTCLHCLYFLLGQTGLRALLMNNSIEMALELIHVLHRLLLTRDCVDSHLLCLAIIDHILIAAHERLFKEREDWLIKETPTNRSGLLINPKVTNLANMKSDDSSKLTNGLNMMTSSTMLQTTGFIDPELYELAEGGYLASYFNRQEHDLASNSRSSWTFAGLKPGRSLVFACLEVVICTLARYRPQIVKNCQHAFVSSGDDDNGEGGGLATSESHSTKQQVYPFDHIPLTSCARNANAPCIMAAAIKCLIHLIDLCAPKCLLYTLSLTNSQTPNAPTVNQDQTASSNKRSTSLLPFVLELATQTVQIALIKEINKSPIDCQQVQANSCLDPDPRKSNGYAETVQFHDLNGLSAKMDETEITSTSACHLNVRTSLNQKNNSILNPSLLSALGWSESQFELAEIYITLMTKLVTHHYPILINSMYEKSMERDLDMDNGNDCRQEDDNHSNQMANTCDVQPDSSAACTHPVNDKNKQLDNNDISNMAFIQWYNLISLNILNIIRHDHVDSNKSMNAQNLRCCLSAQYLVSRIIVHCPIEIFKASELFCGVIGLSCRSWRLTDLIVPNMDSTDETALIVHNELLKVFLNLQFKHNCLVCMNLLCTHSESLVNATFIKALAPQIFRWLCDLSKFFQLKLATASVPLPTDDETMFLSTMNTTHFKNCLNSAIDLLIFITDLAQAPNRQALLLIIIPLLCNLLLPNCQTSQQSSCCCLSQLAHSIHSITLKHIIAIAPRFPVEFRAVCAAIGEDLKSRLENSIKMSHFSATNNIDTNRRQSPGSASSGTRKMVSNINHVHDSASYDHVIKLKTDFSHFT